MQPRSEPLLWLQCLALGAIPLELLLIRLVLAGADPGPVPGVERFLIWGVGVLAPALALWRRPADWGSLVLVRQPLANRSNDQLRISGQHSGLISRMAVVSAAIILLPTLWWLDNSAVLASEFSPVSGQSRLITLLLISPLLALIVWQWQQLVQATVQLVGSEAMLAASDSTFRADAVAAERTSLGLQLLNLPTLEWPEPAVAPRTSEQDQDQKATDPLSAPGPQEAVGPEPSEPEPETDDGAENKSSLQKSTTKDIDAPATVDVDPNGNETKPDQRNNERAEASLDADGSDRETDTIKEIEITDQQSTAVELSVDEESEPDQQELKSEAVLDSPDSTDEDEDNTPPAPPESSIAVAASLPVEPKQPGEEEKGTRLDSEISQVDTVASGSTEGHREQPEPSRSEEREPEQPS